MDNTPFKWIKFEDKLPTEEEPLGQKFIFFGHPDWATYFRGMYTHRTDCELRERLSEYKPDIDRFHNWEHEMPTHWCLLPENPTWD